MCHSCDPGVAQLAQWLTQGMDLSGIPTATTATAEAVADATTKIIFKGTILTMAGGTFSPVEALVVSGDTIVHVGTFESAREAGGPEAVVVDLHQQCVLPGFIDPHVHLILTALADYYLLKLSPIHVTTIDQAKEIIQNAIPKDKTDKKWIAGYGYDPSRVTGHPDLTKAILDGISTAHPIFIMNQSAHVAYVNSEALRQAGITIANAGPNYQQIDGELTGVIYEKAVADIGKLVPPMDPQKMIQACQCTLGTWASKGCTTVFDAGIGTVSPTDLPLMKAVTTLASPPVRFYGAMSVHVLPTPNTYNALLFQSPIKLGSVEVQAVKLWADGSTQGFTAALTQPYYKPPPKFQLPAGVLPFGTLNYADENALYNDMAPWLKAGFQILVHANGDRATEQTLNVYEALLAENHNVPHAGMHRIEHFTVTSADQRTRAKRLGLAISHTIGHVNYWGKAFDEYVLGSERAKVIDPLSSDEKAGLVWSLHSDSPVTDVDPIRYLKTAITRRLSPDAPPLDNDTSECVCLETALRGITINPATQIGIENIVGTLEVGKKADMVILNTDPRTLEAKCFDTKLRVEQTWMGGKLIFPKPPQE